MTGKSPKELLANNELVGFVRPLQGRTQTVRRASSAKVGKPGASPKKLLTDHELVGFVRSPRGNSQMVRRASSAKVTKPPEPVKGEASARRSPETSDN